jgi:hypothetical protein
LRPWSLVGPLRLQLAFPRVMWKRLSAMNRKPPEAPAPSPDDVLRRMLNTPPTPKKKPQPPAKPK